MSEGRDLPDLSDDVVREADAIRRLEREKQTLPLGGERFRGLAREIAIRARRLLRLTTEEERVGEQLPQDGRSIEQLRDDQEPPQQR